MKLTETLVCRNYYQNNKEGLLYSCLINPINLGILMKVLLQKVKKINCHFLTIIIFNV
jgi:hypothetical protein